MSEMATAMAIEVERATKGGDTKVAGFSKAIRSLDNPGFVEGETFEIPSEYDVYETHIKSGDRVNSAEYIFVNTSLGAVKKFFPSTFTKSTSEVREVNGLLELTGNRVVTSGSATEEFRKEGTVEKGMSRLKGKTIKVSRVTPVKGFAFGKVDETKVYNILTLDIVEETPSNNRRR
jgi:hypothetical protein